MLLMNLFFDEARSASEGGPVPSRGPPSRLLEEGKSDQSHTPSFLERIAHRELQGTVYSML